MKKCIQCPFCGFDLKVIPLISILEGYPPYHCKICDVQFYPEEIEKYLIMKKDRKAEIKEKKGGNIAM